MLRFLASCRKHFPPDHMYFPLACRCPVQGFSIPNLRHTLSYSHGRHYHSQTLSSSRQDSEKRYDRQARCYGAHFVYFQPHYYRSNSNISLLNSAQPLGHRITKLASWIPPIHLVLDSLTLVGYLYPQYQLRSPRCLPLLFHPFHWITLFLSVPSVFLLKDVHQVPRNLLYLFCL